MHGLELILISFFGFVCGGIDFFRREKEQEKSMSKFFFLSSRLIYFAQDLKKWGFFIWTSDLMKMIKSDTLQKIVHVLKEQKHNDHIANLGISVEKKCREKMVPQNKKFNKSYLK